MCRFLDVHYDCQEALFLPTDGMWAYVVEGNYGHRFMIAWWIMSLCLVYMFQGHKISVWKSHFISNKYFSIIKCFVTLIDPNFMWWLLIVKCRLNSRFYGEFVGLSLTIARNANYPNLTELWLSKRFKNIKSVIASRIKSYLVLSMHMLLKHLELCEWLNFSFWILMQIDIWNYPNIYSFLL